MPVVAAETVTSPSLWAQVAAIAGALAAIAGAGAAILKFVPGVRGVWAAFQYRRRLERVAALSAIVQPIVERAIEAPIAEVRAQVIEGHERVRAELIAHTTQERQLVEAVMDTAVRVRAMRQSDVDEIRRVIDPGGSFEQVREIEPGP